MKKEVFIDAINSIQNQLKADEQMAIHLGDAFGIDKNEFCSRNHFLENALLKVLQHAMNDLELCQYGQSWIEYFICDLNFGRNKGKKIKYKDKEVKLYTASDLYDFLVLLNRDKDLVECGKCGEEVEMISTGEFCPYCSCKS